MVLEVVIVVHIAAGLTATVSGATAMLAPKRGGKHPRGGRVYLSALTLLVVTAIGIVFARPHTAYLLLLGGLALATAAMGFTARRKRWHGWLQHHIIAMATSYIAMLTAFYVDNGPRLPLWELLPPLSFWFLPTAVGVPILIRALRHHTAPPGQRRDSAPAPTQPP
jgi:formate hydrogenlyase subunit 3/multisubunit Na+/H+ antiporter MnhD subunit